MKTEKLITPFLSRYSVPFRTIGMAAIILAGLTAMRGSAQDSITVANPSFETGYTNTHPGYLSAIPGWANSSRTLGINNPTGPFWDNGGTVDSSLIKSHVSKTNECCRFCGGYDD